MNQREKILAAATGIVAVLFITYLAINRVFLMPAAQRYGKVQDLMQQIEAARSEKAKEASYQKRLKELAGRAYGTDPLRVSERIRSRLTELLVLAGLETDHLTLRPVTGGRAAGIYREVGWFVQIRGKLDRIVDFLYLVTKEPHLHRLDNLVVKPVRGQDEVELQVKYGTLVLEPKIVQDVETDAVDAEVTRAVLRDEGRRQYDVIASRAFFRPYVPAPPPKPRPPPPTKRDERPPPPPPPQPVLLSGQYRVVSLSSLSGEPEVVVREKSTGSIKRYQPGDDLAGGRIVVVDYRPLPNPENPDLLSGSRVVLRIGSGYFAVELGTYLAQKYRLGPERIPPGLPDLTPAPANEALPAPGTEASQEHEPTAEDDPDRQEEG